VRNHGWPDKWFGLVTGFLEREETPEVGVLREVQEELGLAAEMVRLVGVYGFAAKNELIVAYHVRAEGEITLGDELEAYKIVPVPRLRPWPFGTGDAVRDWLAAREG
jgi:NAD+ diphosphatase